MPRRFVTLDVFTDEPFGGNQLALIPDARGLDQAAMQAITREFNYSESIFLLPSEDDANDLRARIFTPGQELGFAGHPNIGLGVWASHQTELFGRKLGDLLRVEEQAGLVPLALDRTGVRPVATLTAPGVFQTGAEFEPARAAACAHLGAEHICTDRHAPVMASKGMRFLVSELASRDALIAARPNADAFDPLDRDGVHEALFYVRNGDDVEMRMFACSHGIPEDAATGSAAGVLVSLLASLEPGDDFDLELNISQGAQMGRPSHIRAMAQKRTGEVVETRVAGSAVIVAQGELLV